MKIVKGYLHFKLEQDADLNGFQSSMHKLKKYTVEKQYKQYQKAVKELMKQESIGLIVNLQVTEFDKGATITWERLS